MTQSATLGALALAAAIVSAIPVAARAEQAPAAPAAAGSGSYLNLQLRARKTTPLFGQAPRPPRPVDPNARPQQSSSSAGPHVVCGMTLVPGNPAIDPGIQRPSASPAVRPAIRAVEPSICWDAAPQR